MNTSELLQLLTTVATGAGIYAGMKAQIAALSERVAALRDTVAEHAKHIDNLRDRRHCDGISS